jgi:hypothetical protein
MAWDTYAGSGEHLRPDVNILFAYVYNKIVGFTIMRYGDEDAHLLAVARR